MLCAQNEADYKSTLCLWMTGVLVVITKWSNGLVGRQFTCVFSVAKTLAVWSLYKSLNKHVVSRAYTVVFPFDLVGAHRHN